jgi:hypothetical protein
MNHSASIGHVGFVKWVVGLWGLSVTVMPGYTTAEEHLPKF